MQSLLFHVSNLKKLHLVDLNTFEDENIAELIHGALLMEELYIEGIPVGVHTIEAICSNIPNLKSLTII